MVWSYLLSPGFIIFMLLSSVGTLLVLLSGGLLGMWLCLEIGFFGFIPIMNGKTVAENESAVKYFVVQGVGSGIMLFSFLIISSDFYLVSTTNAWFMLGDFLMLVGFMVKLGVFPMHFWFPSVMGGASWFSCFWLSVIQKLGPFWALGGLGLGGWCLSSLLFSMVFTSIVGAFGGLAQVQFRPLLAYSSLGQTGWMGLVVMLSVELFIYYIFIYSLLLLGVLWSLNTMNSYKLSEIAGWSYSKGLLFWMFSCSFFISLSGLPPLAGSALKLMGVVTIVNFYPLLLSMLIFTSMVSLYYYLTMFISGVVCVGGGKFSTIDGLNISKGLAISFLVLGVFNWFGGLPLFMMVGGISI